jgi:hypothetical protein
MNLDRNLTPRIRQAKPDELKRLERLYAGDRLVTGRVAKELSRRLFKDDKTAKPDEKAPKTTAKRPKPDSK